MRLIVMRNFNVVKIDSKGRILIPFHIRNQMGLDNGQELIVTDNEKKELKILPLIKGRTVKMKIYMNDNPGSLSRVLDMVTQNGFDVITSMSRTIEKGSLAEWSAILDNINGNAKTIEKRLASLKDVKKTEIMES